LVVVKQRVFSFSLSSDAFFDLLFLWVFVALSASEVWTELARGGKCCWRL
jgi:hypothetical protein